MCKYCEELLNVAADRKANTVLADNSVESSNACVNEMIMEVNHEDDGTPYAFICSRVHILSTDREYANVINI